MIAVELKIYFSFREQLAGDGKLTISLPDNSSIANLLEKTSANYPAIEGKLFESSGKLRRFIQVRINETNIEQLEGLETELHDGDTLHLLPKLGGG